MTIDTALLRLRAPYDSYRWAQQLFSDKDYIEAGQVLEYLLEHFGDEPGVGEARELLARSYYHSAQVHRAAETAQQILDRDPGNAYAVMMLVRSLQRAGRTEEAAAAQRLALAYDVDVSVTR